MLHKILMVPLILFFSFSGFTVKEKSNCQQTEDGPAINWSPDVKLKWSDFKSKKKVSAGFSVAASTCGFGYEGLIQGDNISVNIFVRFYCKQSWKNPNYMMGDVLEHEQLHFDICEVYGRKFYRGIVKLREENKFTEKSLQHLYNSLVDEYDAVQDIYDDETGHSTKTGKQENWNVKINRQLIELSAFASYKEF